MTVVKSTGSRFLCYEPLIKMITLQGLAMAYHYLEQMYEPRLEPVSNGYWRALCQWIHVHYSLSLCLFYYLITMVNIY